ncbi:hypothetical protein ACR6L5_005302, partial [Escherichia coli]
TTGKSIEPADLAELVKGAAQCSFRCGNAILIIWIGLHPLLCQFQLIAKRHNPNWAVATGYPEFISDSYAADFYT